MIRDRVGGRRSMAGGVVLDISIIGLIVGLVLGGISVAKELFREAEYSRVAKYVGDWKKVYDLYHQRTGVVLGDHLHAPTTMVNGAVAVPRSRLGTSGGSINAQRICHQTAADKDLDDEHAIQVSSLDLFDLLAAAGLKPPQNYGLDSADRFPYQDERGQRAVLRVCFQWNKPGTPSGAGNVMALSGVTPALAAHLDHFIDGEVNALGGRLRQHEHALPRRYGQPAVRWGDDGSGSQSPLTDKLPHLTAHWAMDR